jgi:hypothetical protein
MKSKLIFILLIGLNKISYSQLYDAQWEVGGVINLATLDFAADTVAVDSIPGTVGFRSTNACISDENGNLLYYTNGTYITDRAGNLLLNGDSLSPCTYTSQQYIVGLDLPQATLFLPKPSDSNYYYLFHLSLDTIEYRVGNLYYSLIDKRGNGGLGAVVKKNVSFLNGTIMRTGGITACKHANGRDYWIVIGISDTNGFYKFLLTPDTILGPFIQYIGPVFPFQDDYASSKFSQDGSKYVTGIYGYAPILIMDFDRCTGEFSNVDTVFNEASTDPINNPLSGCVSLEFSPNGRFVYASNVINLNQYDLLSANIQDSVAVYTADSNEFYGINLIQSAPDGKIYGSTFNGGLKAFHVVNYPDSLGESCDFVYGGQPTITYNDMNVPNLINYQLGPLAGSGCDTIPALCNSATTSITASVCKGQAYTVGNFVHNQTGFYSDTLQNINGCDSVVSLQLTVDTVAMQLSQPSHDTLIVSGSGSITWLDCNANQLVEGATSTTFVPKTSGMYAAIVTSGNCSDTSECVTAIANGIQEINNNYVRIYPNPTNSIISIVLSQSIPHTVILYDMNGALLSVFHYKGFSEQLDLSNFSNGVYFITINTDAWSVKQKVVKME